MEITAKARRTASTEVFHITLSAPFAIERVTLVIDADGGIVLTGPAGMVDDADTDFVDSLVDVTGNAWSRSDLEQVADFISDQF